MTSKQLVIETEFYLYIKVVYIQREILNKLVFCIS